MGGERREAEGERRDVGGKSLSPVMKINNLLRDHTGQAQAIAFGRIFKPKKNGRIYGWTTELTSNFHQFFKSTLYIHPESFMQIS